MTYRNLTNGMILTLRQDRLVGKRTGYMQRISTCRRVRLVDVNTTKVGVRQKLQVQCMHGLYKRHSANFEKMKIIDRFDPKYRTPAPVDRNGSTTNYTKRHGQKCSTKIWLLVNRNILWKLPLIKKCCRQTTPSP